MTETDAEIAFLDARMDEDEAAAKVAAGVAGPDWTWETGLSAGEATDYVTGTDGTLLLDTLGGIESEAPHVARHDPARVLREVEAGRALIAEYRRALEKAPGNRPLLNTLRRLISSRAAVWSDHPDYDPAWRPAP